MNWEDKYIINSTEYLDEQGKIFQYNHAVFYTFIPRSLA